MSESQSLDVHSAASLLASQLGKDPEPQAAEQEVADHDAAALEALKAEQEPVVEAENQDAQPQKYTVKIDGTEVEVTLDDLKNGYQRQQDYTRKTMEVAEQRKAIEAEVQAARQERQAYAQNLQQMQQQLGQVIGEQQNIDWQQLLNTDPVEYLKQQHLYQQRQAAFQQVQQEQARLWQQQQAEQQAHVQKFMSEQQEQLLAKLPDWKDEAKAKAEKADLANYLKGEGYDDQTINGISDHRSVILARKAMMYDRLMAKAQAASKKVQPLPPKVERPGVTESGNMDRRSASYQRLAKSGRVEDAAAVFANLL